MCSPPKSFGDLCPICAARQHAKNLAALWPHGAFADTPPAEPTELNDQQRAPQCTLYMILFFRRAFMSYTRRQQWNGWVHDIDPRPGAGELP